MVMQLRFVKGLRYPLYEAVMKDPRYLFPYPRYSSSLSSIQSLYPRYHVSLLFLSSPSVIRRAGCPDGRQEQVIADGEKVICEGASSGKTDGPELFVFPEGPVVANVMQISLDGNK